MVVWFYCWNFVSICKHKKYYYMTKTNMCFCYINCIEYKNDKILSKTVLLYSTLYVEKKFAQPWISNYTHHNHFVKNFFLEKPAIAAKPSKVKKDERPVCMILQYVIIFFDAMEHMFKTNF